MADPRFFSKAGPFSLAELAGRCGAELAPGVDGRRLLSDVAPLQTAGPGMLSFLDNRKYVGAFASSRAEAAVVHPEMAGHAPAGMALLLSPDPYRSYAQAATAFYPVPPPEPGIAPTAVVDPTARLADGVRIEAGAVIGAAAEIGPRTLIGPHAVIGRGVVLGEDCVVGAGASVSHALIGKRVNLYPGVRVGQDGFGFAMGPKGHLKVPQLGRVVIHDDVEVGANSTIDRGAGPDTVIGAGTKIDNLVQIGHNVQLGRGCVIVAQVGISGSTRLDDFVVAGGQVGIAGHLHIGSGARMAAQSGVMRDIEPMGQVGGAPAVPLKEFLRQAAVLGQLVRGKGLVKR
jgi:UDP-3-O-[3-hydroxymyristoyl] glucosamine N-acyltransferase